jgi:hypothetical protein
VLEYQNRVATIDWKEYEIGGTAATDVERKEKSYVGRVVEESSSNLLPMAGVASIAALGAAAYLFRHGPRRIR